MRRIKNAKAYATEWDGGGWCEVSWYKENLTCGKKPPFRVRVVKESHYRMLLAAFKDAAGRHA